jgi:hypothetical protein
MRATRDAAEAPTRLG